MKLLFLTEFFPQNNQLVFTGGVEARTYYTVSLAKKDFSVKVIASSSKQVPATPWSVLPRLFYLFISFFKAYFSSFDLIEASNVVTYLPAWFAAKLKKKPVVIWVPDVLGKNWFDFGFIVGITGWLMEKIYLLLPWDGVIALSDSTRVKLLKSRIKAKRLVVIHGGILPIEFKLKTPPQKNKSKTIICIARLVKTKRLDTLLKAFALINSEEKNYRLLIIGKGPQKKILIRLIKALRLDRVKMIDYLPRRELIESLFKSYVFCLPSLVEGFGLVTIEAMAAGLPVVLANIPINQEITEFGRGALFYQPNNESDLAKQLNRLLTDFNLYSAKQLEALTLVKKYSWEKLYQKTKSFYEACFSN